MIVPVITPQPPSQETTELAEYLEQVIVAYRQDHPELTVEEIRQALELASPRGALAFRALAIGLAALLAVGVVLLFFVGR